MNAPRPTAPRFTQDEPFPDRAAVWQLCSRRLTLPRLPLIMGILNVTPDSFSDGGRFADVSSAVDRGLRLAAEGADILDIGGESSRPYSEPVDLQAELARVIPVIQRLAPQMSIPMSIDTCKAAVAREAVAAGVEIINDVSGLEADPQMIDVARSSKAGVCAMHMQGTPRTMQDNPAYDDVVQEIRDYLRQRRDQLATLGFELSRVALDPGIGFGKTHQHNLTLLANCHRFHALGCPLVVGPSRKSFIAKVIADKEADRTTGTIGVVVSLARQGVQVVRVHDVAAVRQALLLFQATGGFDGQALTLDP